MLTVNGINASGEQLDEFWRNLKRLKGKKLDAYLRSIDMPPEELLKQADEAMEKAIKLHEGRKP